MSCRSRHEEECSHASHLPTRCPAAVAARGGYALSEKATGAENATLPQEPASWERGIYQHDRGVGVWDGCGPWGGNVRALVASPHDPSRVLCACGFSWATESGGVWLSETGGAAWVDSEFPTMPVYGLAASNSEPGVFYAGAYSGLYRSINDGVSWTRIAFPGQFILGTGVKVDDGDILVAGLSSDQGIRRSDDRGVNWHSVGINSGYMKGFASSPLAPERMYIAICSENSAAYRSDNAGADWTPIGPYGCWGYGLYVDPLDPDRVFVTVAINGPYGIHRTTNGGTTWERVLEGLSYAPVVERSGILYAAIMEQGVYSSTDGGDTWTPDPEGIVEDFWQAGAASAEHVLFGHWGGIYRSNPARSGWTVSQDGLNNAFVHSLAYYADSNELWAGVEGSGLWRSRDGGGSWELMVNGLNTWDISGIAPAEHLHYSVGRMAVPTDDGIYISDDGGATWNPAGLQGQRITDVAIHWSDPDCMWAGTASDGVLRTTNGGDIWLGASGLPSALYADIELCEGPGGLRVLVSFQEMLGAPGAVHYSDDGGASFTAGTGLESSEDQPALSVRLASPDCGERPGGSRLGGIAYCATEQGIYRSVDDGETWEHAGNLWSRAWSVLGSITSDVYAGRQGAGVYRSTNEGDYWEAYNDGIASATVWNLAYGMTADLIFAATRGGGVKGVIIEGGSGVAEPFDKIRWVQTYPNPLVGSGTLEFEAPVAGAVHLRIFDVSGRPVLNELLKAASGSSLWHWAGTSAAGRALPSGTYYYDLEGAGLSASGRWVILR